MERKMWILALAVLSLASTLSVAQTFTARPSTYQGGGSGYYPNGFDDPTYAYDGNLATDAYANPATGSLESVGAWTVWSGFPSAPQGASGMTLNISSAYSTGEGGSVLVYYSLDGKTSQTLYFKLDGQSRTKATDSIPLSNSQNLTLISVEAKALALSNGHFASTASQSIYEIWVSGND